jgi:hypothetical protein
MCLVLFYFYILHCGTEIYDSGYRKLQNVEGETTDEKCVFRMSIVDQVT